MGSGISASINAMGKVGLMLLDGGRGLISSDYIHNAGTPKSDIAALPQTGETVHPGANKHYGYLFWNNGNGAMADVPNDAFWSWGLGDSFILVVPSLKLVAARAGNAWESGWGKLSALQPFFAAACAAVS